MHHRTAQLIDQLETEARHRAWSLEALGKLPGGFTSRHYPLTVHEQRELRRLKAAAAAATDADTYVALVKGEAVPAHRLRRQMVNAYRRRAA